MPHPLHSKSWPIHHSLIALALDAVQFELQTKTQNETEKIYNCLNPLDAELNLICYLLALLGAHHFLHVSRIRVKNMVIHPHKALSFGVLKYHLLKYQKTCRIYLTFM